MAERANLPRGVRRLATAVAPMVVLAAIATGGDSLAQSPTVSTPSLSIDTVGLKVNAPALNVTAPTLPVAPAPAPSPSLPVPKLPPTPKVPTAPVELPSSRDTPLLPRVDGGGVVPNRARVVGGTGGAPSGESLRPPGSLVPTTVSRSGAANSQTTGEPSVTARMLSQAGLAAVSLPSRSELAQLPPARRRELIRRTLDTPLRERRLRQLRKTIRRYGGCLRALPDRGRLVLELRAGLLGGDPLSRRTIGRRIGVSPRAVVRLERSSTRRLIDAGERGLCVGGSVAAALGGLTEDSGGPAAIVAPGSDRNGGPTTLAPAGDVLADADSGGPSPFADLGDGEEGPAETLLFFLAALLAVLGPLAAIAIASRRRADDAATPYGAAGERPLLFLDVDGVIVLDPFSDGAPPGRIRESPVGLSYVPDRAGALVRKLATRFDIVWATGWGHRANTGLADPLELPERLPVLSFGKKARFGSSDWKIKPVKDYAGDRPAAWLDDNFAARHEHWAAHRGAPTLLVRVDSRVGLTPEQVDRLVEWADGLARPQAARPIAAPRD
jgi:hypothetical protein